MHVEEELLSVVLVSRAARPSPSNPAPARSVAVKPAGNVSPAALLFETVQSQSGRSSLKTSCTFQPASSLDMQRFVPLFPRPVYGCVGLVEVQNDVFLGVVTDATRVASVAGKPVLRVNNVAFISLLNASYDTAIGQGYMDDNSSGNQPSPYYQTDATIGGGGGQGNGGFYHPCTPIAKLLSAGSFFISPHFDITRTVQKFTTDVQCGDTTSDLFENADMGFLWNSHMLQPLLDMRARELTPDERNALDRSGMLIPCIQGYVGQVGITVGGRRLPLTLISRLGCGRAGTRLLSRGVDDDGNVSNFVETEMVLSVGDGRVSSFVQIRGSIPLFWEQTGIQMTHKITIARGLESSMPAFKKHMQMVIDRYRQINIVNLLSQKPQSSEQQIAELFERAIHSCPELEPKMQYTAFDFHSIVKKDGYDQIRLLINEIREYLDRVNYFLSDNNGDPIIFQEGIVRTNCLDCLDRTNVVQTQVAKYTIMRQLADLGAKFATPYEEDEFLNVFNGIWADNGDWLSKIYAGTGALKSSVTRKGKSTFLGLLDDAVKSTQRFYINNFSDKGRQDAIDYMLGKDGNSITLLARNPLHEAVHNKLYSKINEFSSTENIYVFVGTWNVNGKMDIASNVSTWIRPTVKLNQAPHIYCLGIQELIELNAGSYITSDSTKIQADWEYNLLSAINRFANAEYVTLRSANLVALGLFLFVRKDCVSNIRDLSVSIKRTGLGGIAANKGGIGISLFYNDSPIVLVTAHFAAGQQSISERNSDFMSISDELNFKGRKIYEHEFIAWFGDFNYRINEDYHVVKSLIERGAIPELLEKDQLKQQQRYNSTFIGYNEGEIEFNPTYKYDNGTNVYDTSEKMRTPAWTDRVLYKGAASELLEYTRAECLVSDHRPVRGVFKLTTRIIDVEKKEQLQTQLYRDLSGTVRSSSPERIPPAEPREVKNPYTTGSPSSKLNQSNGVPNFPRISNTQRKSSSQQPSAPSQEKKPVLNAVHLLDADDPFNPSSETMSASSSVKSLPIQTIAMTPQAPTLTPSSSSALSSKFEKLNLKHGLASSSGTSSGTSTPPIGGVNSAPMIPQQARGMTNSSSLGSAPQQPPRSLNGGAPMYPQRPATAKTDAHDPFSSIASSSFASSQQPALQASYRIAPRSPPKPQSAPVQQQQQHKDNQQQASFGASFANPVGSSFPSRTPTAMKPSPPVATLSPQIQHQTPSPAPAQSTANSNRSDSISVHNPWNSAGLSTGGSSSLLQPQPIAYMGTTMQPTPAPGSAPANNVTHLTSSLSTASISSNMSTPNLNLDDPWRIQGAPAMQAMQPSVSAHSTSGSASVHGSFGATIQQPHQPTAVEVAVERAREEKLRRQQEQMAVRDSDINSAHNPFH